MWPCFQATKLLVIALLLYLLCLLHLDLNIFRIVSCPWGSNVYYVVALAHCHCREAIKLSRAQLCKKSLWHPTKFSSSSFHTKFQRKLAQTISYPLLSPPPRAPLRSLKSSGHPTPVPIAPFLVAFSLPLLFLSHFSPPPPTHPIFCSSQVSPPFLTPLLWLFPGLTFLFRPDPHLSDISCVCSAFGDRSPSKNFWNKFLVCRTRGHYLVKGPIF